MAVDEPDDGNVDDDDEPINPLVDALFDEVESLRMQVCSIMSRHATELKITCQLFEMDMRCAMIETETREEVMEEMEERIRKMEQRHARRLRQEVCLLSMLSKNSKIDPIFRLNNMRQRRTPKLTFCTTPGCSAQ
jgi:hypothetical protein